jgi:hypothetical protein
MVAIPDLSRLSGAEKDALILALLERLEVAERRIAELEAKPHVTRVHLFGGTCPCCAGAFTAAPEPGLEPGSPFGRSVEALVIYLHAVHAISFQRLSRLLAVTFEEPAAGPHLPHRRAPQFLREIADSKILRFWAWSPRVSALRDMIAVA